MKSRPRVLLVIAHLRCAIWAARGVMALGLPMLLGVTPAPAGRVSAPRVLESPLCLECTLHREIPLGSSVFVVGEVVLAHADDTLLSDGRVDPAHFDPSILDAFGRNHHAFHDIFEQHAV